MRVGGMSFSKVWILESELNPRGSSRTFQIAPAFSARTRISKPSPSHVCSKAASGAGEAAEQEQGDAKSQAKPTRSNRKIGTVTPEWSQVSRSTAIFKCGSRIERELTVRRALPNATFVSIALQRWIRISKPVFGMLVWMSFPTASAIDLFKARVDAHPLEFLTGKPNKPSSKNNRALILQQEMMDFSDRYTMAMWQDVDAYLRGTTDPGKRLRAETFKVLFCAASMQIAAGRDPTANLLDMYVFISLGRQMVREKMGEDFWGPQSGALNASYDSLKNQIASIVVDYIGEKGRAELDARIRDWQIANPDAFYISGIRLRDLAGLRAGTSQKSAPVPFLSEFQKTVGDLEEALHTGDRLMFYIERMPRMTTMQSSLMLAQIAAEPSLQLLSRSAETAAASIDTLPQDLQNLADTQAQTLRELLPAVHPVVENARAAVESYERIQSTGLNSDESPWTPEKTGEVLEKATRTLDELNTAIQTANASLGAIPASSSQPLRLVGDLQRISAETVDRIFERAMWLIAAFFSAALVLILVAARVRRGPKKSSPAASPLP